jgi:uncharacterized protein YkwD
LRHRMNTGMCLRAMAALAAVIFLGTPANGQAPATTTAPATTGYYYTQAPSTPSYTYTTQPTTTPTYTYAAQPTYTYPATAGTNYTYATTQPAATTATTGAVSGSAGFLSWLNSVRAQYGLPAVGYDANLENWAAQNSAAQASRGLGHFVMGPARRQNSAMGNLATIGSQWLASPAHRAALLDPTIRAIGLAGYGAYWTFNAY